MNISTSSTKHEIYTLLLNTPEVLANPQLAEFIKHEPELLDSFANDKKPVAEQCEYEKLGKAILVLLLTSVAHSLVQSL